MKKGNQSLNEFRSNLFKGLSQQRKEMNSTMENFNKVKKQMSQGMRTTGGFGNTSDNADQQNYDVLDVFLQNKNIDEILNFAHDELDTDPSEGIDLKPGLRVPKALNQL
jgi:hypothetical protein